MFSLRVHVWIQTTASQFEGLRGRRRKRQLSFTLVIVVYSFVGRLYSDVAKTTLNNFRPVGTAFSGESPKPGLFCSSAATVARFFHVEIFWLVGESNTKFARHIPCCAWSAIKWITRSVYNYITPL